MTRDFASNNKRRSGATRFKEQANETGTGFNTMIIGLVLGIIVALVAVYFYQSTPTEEPISVTKAPVEKPSAETRYKAVPIDEIEQSDFTYYDELPKKNIDTQEQAESLPDAKQPSNKVWIMQCASLRQFASAENLRAQIALLGLEAFVKKTAENNARPWYRVQLGPYKSKRNAEKDRHELQRNNIEGCRIW